MDFELKSLGLSDAATWSGDALLVLVPEQPVQGAGALASLVDTAHRSKDLEASPGATLALYRAAGVKAPRVVLARAGDTAAAVRKAVAAGVGALRQPSTRRLALVFAGDSASPAAVQAAVQAVAESSYVYTTTKPSAKARTLQKVTLGVPDAAAVKAAFATGQALVAGVETAKEWANRPANHATPSHLAEAARALAKRPGLSVEVLGPKQVQALGMGAFLAVAQGSEEPLRFIVLRYQGAAKSQAPVVLVGKGITFDTGGISIKPAPEMDEMKFDMSGAASVLGTFAALADLKPAVNVVGLIPACENMPDGRAVKPGDVVTSMSGQTIEILNTDAEGRLILCDALTYAKRFKPHSVIDIATLTGACVIALGAVRTGLFSPRDELADALMAAGERAGDLCWRLPLDDEYAEGLKSNFADVANVAGRAAGSVTAAKFLQRFATELPWAHLDIAGTAWRGGAAKGATGRPVALLVQYLLDTAAAAAPAAPRRGKTARG